MPRPCLKLNHRPEYDTDDDDPLPFAQDVAVPPHVHFPPTPTLTSTHTTHSSSVYDRAPINVSPNRCELPERGGRVYTPSPERRCHRVMLPRDSSREGYFQPHAFRAAGSSQSSSSSSIPPLIPDLASSESDETSDVTPGSSPRGTSHIPTIPTIPINVAFDPRPHMLHHNTHSAEEIDNALSFLPHPPSHPKEKLDKVSKRRSPSRCQSSGNERHRIKSTFESSRPDDDSDGCLGGF